MTIFVVKVLLDFNILNLYMKYGKIVQIMWVIMNYVIKMIVYIVICDQKLLLYFGLIN